MCIRDRLTTEQQAIVHSQAASAIIAALAGTGKTTTLACCAVQALRAQPDARILVLTSFGTADKIFPSLNAGASGYLLKDSDPGELLTAIHKVFAGEGWLHPAITRQVLSQLNQQTAPQPAARAHAPEDDLTEREMEVLRFIAQGLSNQEIARNLTVSEATVHSHVSKVLTKLNLNSRTQAALYALRKGIATLD